jgi:hypothetical protein
MSKKEHIMPHYECASPNVRNQARAKVLEEAERRAAAYRKNRGPETLEQMDARIDASQSKFSRPAYHQPTPAEITADESRWREIEREINRAG